jgi:hypothetical protein
MLYCIEHGNMEKLDGDFFGHLTIVHTKYGEEADLCQFEHGWATCPPPELKPDWMDGLVEPSQEEIELVDENSLELAADFGV